MKHLKIIITGRVQGVWFRASAMEKAAELGLTGSVQNLPGGSLEIHAEGEQERLNQLLEWCKDGPKNAAVDKIETSLEPIQNYRKFRII